MAQEFKVGQKVVIVGVLGESNCKTYPLSLELTNGYHLTFTNNGYINNRHKEVFFKDYNQFLEEIKTTEGLGKPLEEKSFTEYNWKIKSHNHIGFVKKAYRNQLIEFVNYHKLPIKIIPSDEDLRNEILALFIEEKTGNVIHLKDNNIQVHTKTYEQFCTVINHLGNPGRFDNLSLLWSNFQENTAVMIKGGFVGSVSDVKYQAIKVNTITFEEWFMENARSLDKVTSNQPPLFQSSVPQSTNIDRLGKTDFIFDRPIKSPSQKNELKQRILELEVIVAQLKLENFELQNK